MSYIHVAHSIYFMQLSLSSQAILIVHSVQEHTISTDVSYK